MESKNIIAKGHKLKKVFDPIFYYYRILLCLPVKKDKPITNNTVCGLSNSS